MTGIWHQVLLGSALSGVVVEAHPDEVAHLGAEVRLGPSDLEPLERLGDERVAPAAADQAGCVVVDGDEQGLNALGRDVEDERQVLAHLRHVVVIGALEDHEAYGYPYQHRSWPAGQ